MWREKERNQFGKTVDASREKIEERFVLFDFYFYNLLLSIVFKFSTDGTNVVSFTMDKLNDRERERERRGERERERGRERIVIPFSPPDQIRECPL